MEYGIYFIYILGRYSTSAEEKAYSKASDKLLYVQALEDGIVTPSYEEGQKIVQDVCENFLFVFIKN